MQNWNTCVSPRPLAWSTSPFLVSGSARVRLLRRLWPAVPALSSVGWRPSEGPLLGGLQFPRAFSHRYTWHEWVLEVKPLPGGPRRQSCESPERGVNSPRALCWVPRGRARAKGSLTLAQVHDNPLWVLSGAAAQAPRGHLHRCALRLRRAQMASPDRRAGHTCFHPS